MYVSLFVGVCLCEYRYPWSLEVWGHPRAGMQLAVGAGNQTEILWKNMLLMAELSLQALTLSALKRNQGTRKDTNSNRLY